MLVSILRHLSGDRTPAQLGATFVRLSIVFGLVAMMIAIGFRVLGLSASNPQDQLAQLLVGAGLLVLAITSVWFALGAVGVLFRRLGPAGGRDTILIMLAIAAIAGAWSIRGVMLISDGAPVRKALAWNPATPPWGRVVVRGQDVIAHADIGLPLVSALEKALVDHPQIDTLLIWSPGGSSAAADILQQLVRREQLAVVVSEYCASACIPVFLSGDQRIMAPNAILGCHQASNAFTGRSAGPSRNFRDQPVMPGAESVRTAMIRECDAAPPEELFVPTLGDLVTIGAVTHVGDQNGAIDGQTYCANNPDTCSFERGRI